MSRRPTKSELRGERSRELILDTAERLMASAGFAGTSIAAITAQSGLPASSIYWHFGSKDGLLAAVMKRGADRWFAAIPDWSAFEGDAAERSEAILAMAAEALAQHPDFLRLFYLLALELEEGHQAM